MSESTPETTHFGLTRVGSGESFAKNGYAVTDADVVVVDDVLYALSIHSHDGTARLGDPSTVPGLSASTVGGSLPAGTTYYYRVSFLDKYSLETAASDESYVTTPDPLPSPTPPASVVETTLGTLSAGVYTYLVTFTTATGGETTPSGSNAVKVPDGTTNRIRLLLPTLPAGALGWKIYRSRPGQSQFYYVDSTLNPTWYDGGLVEDQSVRVPTTNTTNGTNSITVTIPGGVIPARCFGWRIYRALLSGNYDGTSLVHQVVEGATDTSTDVITTFVDSGGALLAGFPRNTSQTLPGGTLAVGSATGTVRGSRSFSGYIDVITNGSLVTATTVSAAIQPSKLTAFFQVPPNGGATPPVMRIQAYDEAATPNYVELTVVGDGTKQYFHLDLPTLAGAAFEAESGQRSNESAVPISSDIAASNGQAVELNAINESVLISLGALEAGSYNAFTTVKYLGASEASGLRVDVVRTDNNAVLYSGSFSPTTSYAETAAVPFTTPGGVPIGIRVVHNNASGVTYLVDTVRYAAVLPTLQAGTITIRIYEDSTNSAGKANVTLWF